MEFAVRDQHSSSIRPVKDARSASVSIRIIASNPTRKKDPTRAMYSALRCVSVCFCFINGRVGRSCPLMCKVPLHVQTTKKGYRRHIFKFLYKKCGMYSTEGRGSTGFNRGLCKQM